MDHLIKVAELIEKKEKLVAMVAPSFPIMYEKKELLSKLKKLGFSYIVEVSVGAKKTNEEVAALLKANPTARFITSPCASFVRLVRKKYPHLLPYLALKADSPMIATTRIVHEKYPGHRAVFIGPCIVKKLEAIEDYPELNILAITYKELNILLKKYNQTELTSTYIGDFDLVEKETRIYPFDGGLTISGGIKNLLKEDEMRIVSGWKNCEATLEEFQKNPHIRFVDILFCEGGCINGPGVESKLTLAERKQKVLDYANLP